MACIIADGYALGCRDNIGGIQSVFIGNFDTTQNYTFDVDNQIDSVLLAAVPGSLTYYTFEQENETGEFKETAAISNENGTVFYEQTVSLTLHKATAAVKNKLKLLAQGNLSLIVLDQSGVYHLVGMQNGVRVSAIDGGVGKAYGDMNGYTVSFMAKEPQPAVIIDQASASFTLTAN